MGLPEIVNFVRNFTVMIRVEGPDPKGLKMRQHVFHHYNSEKTTLSASGMILPSSFYVAQLAKQYSSFQDKNSLPITLGKPELIPGVQIDIMVETQGKMAEDFDAKVTDGEAPRWLPAESLTLVDIPVSSVALQSLIESSSGSLEHGWEVSWSLALSSGGHQPYLDATRTERVGQIVGAESSNPSRMGKLATRISVLGVSSRVFEDLPNLNISPSNKTGDLLLAMGAPFGILSPVHFCNSISVGSIANSYPPVSAQRSLFMADICCLPGLEGSPVFGEHAGLIGMLARPLRQRGSGAEVQLVIPWKAIATACSDLLLEEPQHAGKGIYRKSENLNAGKILLPSPVEKAMSSICLITIDNGVWASGVVLNNHGLILINAHLLEPWRFTKSDLLFTPSNETLLPRHKNFGAYHRSRGIRVRLDHMDPWIWCDARELYVSKGPLDIALLQLECVPDKLCPIIMDFSCPSPGSKAYVIGHGLFGLRCDFLPSACVGVVAKVVKAKRHVDVAHQSSKEGYGHGDFPALIETTASVHPGGSGGAVVNSYGHIIGLVTSNAKHGGGRVIPHLNFSIPCAALKPVFNFSKDMQDLSLLEVLDKPNEHLSSVWALMPPLSPKPGPSLHNLQPGDKSKDSKGYPFAKFIAERHELFKSTSQLGKAESVSNKFTPSKL